MSFVYPNFLWALLLLIIPIIIHLFNFRKYKTVYFSKVDFLNEVVEDSKSGNKLKHLLILLSRLLMITALVLAFSQPFIPTGENQKTENITSIYIDNSFSMQAIGTDGDLLNEVKNKAIEVIKSMDENEKINLLTSDLLAKDQRFYSKSEIIERIKEIDLTPVSKTLASVLNLQTDLINNSEEDANKRLLIFSDFQTSTSKLDEFNKDEIPTFFYQPKAEISGNVYIDSVWFESPVQRINLPIELHYRIINQSSKEVNDLKTTLAINDNEKAWSNANIAPNSSTEGKISFTNTTTGLKKGKLSIKTNQLFFDDDYFFTYEINESVRILLITQDNTSKNLEQLYVLNPYYKFDLKNINNINQEDFKDKDLIILQNIDNIPSGISEKLDEALKNGSTVSLITGEQANLPNWNSFLNSHKLPGLLRLSNLNSELNYFNAEDPLYYGVFENSPENYKYPKLKQAYPLNISPSNNFISLFNYNNTDPFLIYSKFNNGRIFVQSTPLNSSFSNFQNHALFAATYLRIAETSNLNKKLQFSIGETGSQYPLNTSVEEKNQIHLINIENKVDVIPSVINSNSSRYLSFDQIKEQINTSGFYSLKNEENFKDEVAFNYSRQESEIVNFNKSEIIENFENANWKNVKPLEVNEAGDIEISSLKVAEYWRFLLILALCFLAIEILLLKLWKTK
jgi:hypothetical protein